MSEQDSVRSAGPGRRFVRGLDALLRRFYGVYEFSREPTCVLRLSPTRAKQDIVLADGTQIAAGSPLAVIHFWNEQMPPAPAQGVDLAWAREFVKRLKPTLRLLAQHLPGDARVADARALCGEAVFIGASNMTAAINLLGRLGFEISPSPRRSDPWGRFATFWENTYTWMLIWTYNPATLRGRTMFDLERHWVWMSRAALERLYGEGNSPQP